MDPFTISAIVLTLIGYGIYSLIKYIIDDLRGVEPERKPGRFSREVSSWNCNGWGQWDDTAKPSSGNHEYVITSVYGDGPRFKTLEEAKQAEKNYLKQQREEHVIHNNLLYIATKHTANP